MANEVSNIDISEIVDFDEKKKIIVPSNKETIKKSYELKSNRITLPILTKYEKARVIGERAEQIARGFPPLVEVGSLSNKPMFIKLSGDGVYVIPSNTFVSNSGLPVFSK